MDRRVHYKVVILGCCGVGKSSLATRYIRKIFFEYTESTIGAAFLSVPVFKDEREVIIDIWDTAGQERYHSLASMYYRSSDAVIIVYDITNPESLDEAKKWYNEIRNILSDAYIIFVGNKTDSVDSRKIDFDETKKYTDENKLDLIETSARTGRNVDKLFLQIIENLPDISKKQASSNIKLNNQGPDKTNDKTNDKIKCVC